MKLKDLNEAKYHKAAKIPRLRMSIQIGQGQNSWTAYDEMNLGWLENDPEIDLKLREVNQWIQNGADEEYMPDWLATDFSNWQNDVIWESVSEITLEPIND